MAFKYSLVERSKDPRNPDSEKQWYGTPQSNAPLSGKAMTRAATKNTTTAPSNWRRPWTCWPTLCPSSCCKDTR